LFLLFLILFLLFLLIFLFLFLFLIVLIVKEGSETPAEVFPGEAPGVAKARNAALSFISREVKP